MQMQREVVLLPRLSKTPRSLYDLWKEYMFGFSGNKPAKDFTRAERGAVRSTYSRRNHAWETIARMVRAGHTAERAIDKIYDVYGHETSVTKICIMLVKDNRAGGHMRT